MFLYNRFQPRANGLTPFEDVQQHRYTSKLYEFGQFVLVRKPTALLQAKLEPRWVPGVWLGRSPTTDEHRVAISPTRILCGRSCRPLGQDAVDHAPTLALWKEWAEQAHMDTKDESAEQIEPRPEQKTRAHPGQVSGGRKVLRRPPEPKMPQVRTPTPGCAACEHRMHRLHDFHCRRRRLLDELGRRVKPRAQGELPEEEEMSEQDEQREDDDEMAECVPVAKRALGDAAEPWSKAMRRRRITGKRSRSAEQEAELEDEEFEARTGDRVQQAQVQAAHAVSVLEKTMDRQWISDRIKLNALAGEENWMTGHGDFQVDNCGLMVEQPGEINLVNITGPPWFDYNTGELLEEGSVREAMDAERASLRAFETYDEVPEDEALADAQAEVVSSRWLIIRKAR